MADLELYDNSVNNIVYDPTIYTNVSLIKYNNINTLFDNISISTIVYINKYTNSNTFYNPSISTKLVLTPFNSNTNSLRPLFIEIEVKNVSINLFSNTPIFYNPVEIKLNFNKELKLFNNIPTFSNIIIGENFTAAIVGVFQNINYINSVSVNIENIAYKGLTKRRKTINRPKNFKFKFSDFSFDMLPHPITGDISVLYDVDAINQSIENILKTRVYERPFESYNISAKIHELLFELQGAALQSEIKNVIFNAIVNNEPRILLYDIIVKDKPEQNSISIQIFYQIRTISNIEKFETVLVRT